MIKLCSVTAGACLLTKFRHTSIPFIWQRRSNANVSTASDVSEAGSMSHLETSVRRARPEGADESSLERVWPSARRGFGWDEESDILVQFDTGKGSTCISSSEYATTGKKQPDRWAVSRIKEIIIATYNRAEASRPC